MSVNIGFDMDGDPAHENLVIAAATQIAMSMRSMLEDHGVAASEAEQMAESLTFDLAHLFDANFIQVNGKRYRPRLAFVGEDGRILPGVAEMSYMHEYAAAPLDDEGSFTIVKA